ncbi:MAG: Fic family protein [Nitrospirota bacterium]
MKKSGRYDISALPEAQFEPGSRGRVLKNLLGIKRKIDMDEAESKALKIALDKLLGTYSKNHRFKEADIRKIHKVWLGGIYEWAGKYRQVNVSKGDFPFAAAKQIPSLMAEFERGPLYNHTPCHFKSLERVIQALAEVHVELVLIHPFREGNGRVARMLSTIMASQAGLPILDFTDITGRKRKEYFSAISIGLGRDYKPRERIFRRITEKSLKDRSDERI